MSAVERVALFNPMAGPRWRARRVHEALRLLERDEQVVIEETRPDDVMQQARSWLARGATELIAVGGDGTVCDVAAALVGCAVPLRIVPCGTTNVLARDVGLPVDPVRAIRATAGHQRLRVIQTWSAGPYHVVLGAGIGWDARLLHRLPRRLKRAYGLAVMVPLGAWLALRYDFPHITVRGVDVHGLVHELTGSSVLVCNISHWGGRNVAFPGVDPGDDVLDIIVCTPRNFLHLAAFWSMLMIPGGRPLRLPGVQHVQLVSLSLATTGRAGVELHVNGDVAGRLQPGAAPFEIVPAGSLSVRIP